MQTQLGGSEWAKGAYGVFNTAFNGNADPMLFLEDVYLGRLALNNPPADLRALADAASKPPLQSDERQEAFEDIARYLAETPSQLTLCTYPPTLIADGNLVGLEHNAMNGVNDMIDARRFAFVSE